jgi:fucose permease
MPAGMTLALLAAPWLLAASGWRGTWYVMAGISFAWAAVMAAAFRGFGSHGEGEAGTAWRGLKATLRARGPWLLACCFGFYTLSWLALMVWLPTYVVERRGGSVELAATLTLIAVAINFPGNLTGGWLLSRGIRWSHLAAVGGGALVVCGPLIYLDLLPDGLRFAVCLIYSFTSGMVPAAVLGGAPYFAPGPRQIGATNGLIIQGSHLGQFIGTPLVAATVALSGGWQGGAWVFVASGAGVLIFAALIGREEKRLNILQGSASSK